MATDNYIQVAKRIRKANSEIAVDKANRIADKICNLGIITEEQLLKLNELSVDRLIALEHANPGLVRLQ